MSIGPARQNCSTCQHINKCWALTTNAGKKVSDQNVAINVLVCRLKLGIDSDFTVRNILALLRPGMVRLVSNAVNRYPSSNVDFDTMLLEMQSAAIEYLLVDYNIGDFLVATAYLFHPTRGYLVRWSKWHISKSYRFYKSHELVSEFYSEEQTIDENGEEHVSVISPGDGTEYAVNSADADDELVSVVKAILDDGVSLNHREYRVFVYCMQNANESNAHRHIDGLHLKLAELTGVSRPRITRLYRRAQEKLKNAVTAERGR